MRRDIVTPCGFTSIVARIISAVCVAVVALTLPLGNVPARASVPATPVQRHYLALAQSGVSTSEHDWRDGHLGWYDARLGDRERYPLATIWDIVPLFEALDAIAIADPGHAVRASLQRFASGAERYLNRALPRGPGFSPYPGDRDANTETWFDDNGWWGLAFLNAYRATGIRRYLARAESALRFIANAGWDPVEGGIWWNTDHPYKSGPALASATLLATLIYQQTHSSYALGQARRFLAYANTSAFSSSDGLYEDSSVDSTPVDYIEGPLIYAQALLCHLTDTASECERAETLTQTALRRFGEELDFSPQYDAIYLQWMLALYGLNHEAGLYDLAAGNARTAAERARNGKGLYLLSWNGETLPAQDAEPGMLQTQAATVSLFAWLAVYPPPQ
jgi:Glycosyl hydrolase family 76